MGVGIATAAAVSATISSSLPPFVSFCLGSRRTKCRTTALKKSSLVSPGRLPCFIPNFRAFIPISITMSRRGITTVVFASGADPQREDISKREGEATPDSNTGGPPTLTILAGLVVFLLFLWFAGSLVLWILSLFIR